MEIYRVENPKDGLGPFRSHAMNVLQDRNDPLYRQILREFQDMPFEAPAPWQEAVRMDKERAYNNFVGHDDENILNALHDMTYLHKWFQGIFWVWLVRESFVLSTYEVPEPDVFPLETQVLFRKHSAKLIRRQPLKELAA